MNGQTAAFVHDEKWCWNPNWSSCSSDPLTSSVTKYAITWAREFRYDSARSRYLVRKLDPTQFQAGAVLALEDAWSDYDGDSTYGEYVVSGGAAYTSASYEPGQWEWNGSYSTYLHGDHLGSLAKRTGSDGSASIARRVYTAFGERIGINRPNDRFGYAGAWGYQRATTTLSSDPYRDGFPYLHVGARYYDPASGRFLQRDPIGISGGTNVYAYCWNVPTALIDPSGHGFWNGNNGFHNWMANNFWRNIHNDETLANMSNTRAILEGAVAPAVAVVGSAVAGVAIASGGATASLSVGTSGAGASGLHFAVGTSTAGWWHYAAPGVTGATYWGSGPFGTRIITLPARYPDAIRNMPENAMNCATGALRGFFSAL